MLMNKTRAWIEVDLTKMAHNVEEIRKLIPSTNKIMAIVKANAYGHGDVVVSQELEKLGVDFFGVSSVDEGIHLRENGIKGKILILGYTSPQCFSYLLEYDLIQAIFSYEYASKLNEFAQEHNAMIKGHVKVDTGMSRIGIIMQNHENHLQEIKAIYEMSNLDVCGIFSHFAVSDSLAQEAIEFTNKQQVLFDNTIKQLNEQGINVGTRHIQNSYGVLNYPDLDYDYVRPGLLYMGVTSDNEVAIKTNPDFKPILALKARVSLVKKIQEGVSVSYGRHYLADQEKVIATVSIGYADGYPRILSNKGARVLIHGQYANIVGNICMDQLMIDVTNIKDVEEGDIVTLIGEDGDKVIYVDEISRLANTINNETFTNFSARVPRLYK